LPSMYSFQAPGGSYVVPSRLDDVVAKLRAEFPHERANLDRLLADLALIHETLGLVALRFEEAFTDEDTAFVSRFHNQSIVDYISSFIGDERLRRIFYAMWPYAGKHPEQAPALFCAVMLGIHLFEGSHFVMGGFSALADALARVIRGNGGRVLTGHRVSALHADKERVHTVYTANGEAFDAGTVISNISPYHVHRQLLNQEARRGLWLKRLGRLQPSPSCVAAYLGLSGSIDELFPNTINFWFASDDPSYPFLRCLQQDPSELDHLILLATRTAEPPPTITLMTFAHKHQSSDWRRDKLQIAEAMMHKAESLYPGLRDRVVCREIASPATFERYTGNTGGALYGFDNDRDMYAEAKLPITTYLSNLYQTGHWGKPGAGLWNVMLNAYRTAKTVERNMNNTHSREARLPRTREPRLRLIYPRFRKFLEGHERLADLVGDHVIGDYTMPPSLALPIIAALSPPDVRIALTDDNIGQPIDYDERVDLVVISCFTPQASRAYEIADEFRKRGTKVILGGIHPTSVPEEASRHADSVCVGEVEPVWDTILADLRKGGLKPLYRPETTMPLARVPIPDRSVFDGNLYKWNAHLVLVTRGCPVRCAGCPIPNKEGTTVRLRPIDQILADIHAMPYREFYITDDTVMLPGKKYTQFLLRLMERTQDLDINIFLASTMMMIPDPSFYHKLAAGGASSMYTVFGYDRVSRRLLSPECSRDEWQQGVDLVRMIEDAGIHFFASFGVGFDDQDERIFDRIRRFAQDAEIDLAEFYINTPFPGTPFGEKVEQEGRVLHRDYTLWNTGNVVFKPLAFDEERLLRGFLDLWEDFYRHRNPHQTLRSFKHVRTDGAEKA
jgi:phytoene dehydrogenase-like protein